MERGLEIQEIGPDMFVFSFGHEREKQRVMEGERRLKEFNNKESPRKDIFRFVKFWVPMFNLSPTWYD
ncbi:hypothetical protein PanWU01x14_370200 [Parasponia andersonii]|uniref:DUF4283 domain-containing protein n=1 Tax=Parasponia andersonii TaxID=3476 RepID=A0A2P5A4E2_PARAD|nr:hypothetical protein PanWU01x14_370200 [Parasponia andersonii]